MPTLERGDALGPDDALVVVARLDDRADEARDADAVRAHLDRDALAGLVDHDGLHRLGIFGAEEEDLADLDAAALDAAVLGDLGEGGRVVALVGAGVGRGPGRDDLADRGAVGEVDGAVAEREVGDGAVVEDRALAGRGEDEELVGMVAADRAGVGRIGIAFRPMRS